MDMKNNIIWLILAVVGVGLIGLVLFNNNRDDSDTEPVTQTAPVAEVRSFAADELGISEDMVLVQSVTEMEWPNACLGLAEEDEMCAEVITPGYQIVVEVGGDSYTYRTDMTGGVVRPE
jgi:hypothetical protein